MMTARQPVMNGQPGVVPGSPVGSTRERLMTVAERLFVEQGIRSVPMREIARAAGQRNHSAASYHFGSREGLAEAIFDDRFRPVNDMLVEMLGQVGGQRAAALRTLVELIVFPIAAAVKF